MSRHQRFLPLAQDHFSSLLLARSLILGDSKAKGPVMSFQQKLEVTKKMYNDRLCHHFEAEEKILFPVVRHYAGNVDQLISELLEEHERITAIARSLHSPIGIRQRLHDFGSLLEAHILREEREINLQLQTLLPPDIYASLEEELLNYYGNILTTK